MSYEFFPGADFTTLDFTTLDFGLYDFTTAKTPLLRGAGGVFLGGRV